MKNVRQREQKVFGKAVSPVSEKKESLLHASMNHNAETNTL
jgi:hypothetical protein